MLELETLQFLWYLVVGLAMIMYTLLDGFDLGVGILLPFVKKDKERRLFLNAIGPVWDGNEVWLVIIVGGLFAGFPVAYASVLSGFYNLVMLLLAGLMFRAAAIEFRSKKDSLRWRFFWDYVFCISSLLVAFLYGVGLGNFVQGVPLNHDFVFTGSFSSIFTSYSVLLGFFSILLFTMHGACYLIVKTEKEVQSHLRSYLLPILLLFLAGYLLITFYTFIEMPFMMEPFKEYPTLFVFPLITFFSIFSIFYQGYKKREGWAFLSSCLCILSLLTLFGIGTFPNLMRSTLSEYNNLTIYNSSSSAYTLKVLLTIVLIGVPLVLGYGVWVYRIFGGKVKLDSSSY